MKRKSMEPNVPASLADQNYDAFISYSHGAVDNVVAVEVQRMLEEFRLPKAVGKSGPDRQRHPFRRVFLDQGEMSSCADFAQELKDVLSKTPWLIVICSPRSAGSVWVNWEIETFLEHHDRSRVLAVLIEGGPENAFPEQLRKREGVHGEALAADARGMTVSQIRRKLRRDVLLRIAAPMLDTTYDTLKQRHRLYRLQRMTVAGVGVFCCMASFLVYAMMQNVRIQQQYTATLIEQSRLQAFNAEEKLQANDAMGAIELALRGLQRDGDPRPAVPEAEYALSKALQVYTTENQIGDEAFTTGVFVRENKHTGGFFAADGILFARDGNNIYLWNTQTGKLDQKLPVNGTGVQNLSEHLLVDNARQLIYTDGKDAVCYDYAEGTEVWRATGDEPYSDCYALYLPKKDQVVVIWTSLIQSTLAVSLVDRTTGREIYQDEVKIDGYSMSDSALESSEDGRYIAFFIDTLPGEPLNSAALVYDLEERQTQIFPWKMGAGRTLSFLGDGALAVGMWNKDESWLESENYPGEPWVYKLQTMAQIVCGRVDLESGRWVWQKQFSSGTCDDMQVLVRTVGEQPCVLLLMGNQFLRLDAQSGSVLEEMELEAQFRAVFAADRGMSILAENGRMYRLKYDFPIWTNALYCGKGVYEAVFDGPDTVYVGYTEDGWLEQPEIYAYQEKVADPNFVPIYTMTDEEWVMSSCVVDGVCVSIVNASNQNSKILYRWQGENHCVSGWQDRMILPEILGCCTLEGKQALLILGEDAETYQVKAVAITLEDGVVHQLDLQLSDSWMLRLGYFLLDGVLYELGPDADNQLEDGLWAWTPGTPEPTQIAALPAENPEEEMVRFSDLVVSPNGEYFLLMGNRVPFSVQQEERQIFCVLRMDHGQLKPGKQIDLPKEVEEIIGYAWNQKSTRFAIFTEKRVYLYDQKGGFRGKIELQESEDVPVSVSFAPDGESLLVLYQEGGLERYLLSGQRVNRLELQTTQSRSSKWQYVDSETLILTSSMGSAVLDISEDLFGMRQWVKNGCGWIQEEDQFYVGSLMDHNIGLFPRYTTEELIRLGEERIS